MKLVDMTCPHCKASLKVDPSKKQAFCEYCGAKLLIDDEVQHVHYDNAEEAGYQFEKGRQRAQAEQRKSDSPKVVYVASEKKKKNNMVWWIIGWICCFPIPLTVLIVRNKKLSKKAKAIIIAVIWLLILAIGVGGSTNNSSGESTVYNTTSSEQVTTSETETTSEIETTSEVYDGNKEIEEFVKKYNKKAKYKLKYFEDFKPSEYNNHYRTEFRLPAYENAFGKSYKSGEMVVDFIAHQDYFGMKVIRIYADDATIDKCCDIVKVASPMFNEELDYNELNNTLSIIKRDKEINSYFCDIGITVQEWYGSYNLMLKQPND